MAFLSVDGFISCCVRLVELAARVSPQRRASGYPSVTDTHVTFRYKDRAKGDAPRVETITGAEFVARYLRHVLPRGLRAIRHHGFCHPAAHKKLERIAFHTGRRSASYGGQAGRPLLVGAATIAPPKPPHVVNCPCCGNAMVKLLWIPAAWQANSLRVTLVNPGRAPPVKPSGT